MKYLMGGLVLSACAVLGTQVMAQDSEGNVTVRSAGTGYTPSGPAPDFAQLDSNGNGSIDQSEASGYKLLANDFIKADGNQDGRISTREYERWASLP